MGALHVVLSLLIRSTPQTVAEPPSTWVAFVNVMCDNEMPPVTLMNSEPRVVETPPVIVPPEVRLFVVPVTVKLPVRPFTLMPFVAPVTLMLWKDKLPVMPEIVTADP